MIKQRPIFITGIGTGIGKTFVAAILTQYLSADYWKPIQAGDLDNSDSKIVGSLLSADRSVIHKERYRFDLARSPHMAARHAGVHISLADFHLPESNNRLVIEGAGGLMVPLSYSLFMTDLIQYFDAGVLLVVRNYLGCINHTLLSYELLHKSGILQLGVVINGDMDNDTHSLLRAYIPQTIPFFYIPETIKPTKEIVCEIAHRFEGIIGRTTTYS
jgi:dethiobiotin synthetase